MVKIILRSPRKFGDSFNASCSGSPYRNLYKEFNGKLKITGKQNFQEVIQKSRGASLAELLARYVSPTGIVVMPSPNPNSYGDISGYPTQPVDLINKFNFIKEKLNERHSQDNSSNTVNTVGNSSSGDSTSSQSIQKE